ncbi:hypothetical protein HOF78_00465 [Candidatus Woesearchaeota archaeon]|jgi:hypothetical protein|nr:hypothetical protein [Candidatus Woesearchaeota archaeon]MBT6044561.1 hypothetical protein [Candidatus Woesearchaeota archaeon]
MEILKAVENGGSLQVVESSSARFKYTWERLILIEVLNIKKNYNFSGIHKKGAVPGAAYLVMMIALLLVLYVVMLPEGEKLELMGEGGVALPGQGVPLENGRLLEPSHLLLSDSPGLMKPFLYDVTQRNLASVNLFSLEEQNYESVANNLNLESSVFKSDQVDFVFTVNDLNNLRDIKLLFFVIEGEGELVVKLNGAKILSGEVTNEMLPLTLPSSMIGDVNTLTFEVKRPSLFQFISSNEYVLKDVVLIKNYLVQNNYEARQFVLSNSELSDINHMSLLYRLNCMTVNENGRIRLMLNGKIVHDALSVCDAGITEVDFSLTDLIEGRNVLEFTVDAGQYVLENPIIEIDYTQQDYYRYYFIMEVPDIFEVVNGADVVLQARFTNDGYIKAGNFFVNGYPVNFDTNRDEFVTNLNGLIYEGQNVITVVPDTTFEMVTLDVFLA